MTIVWGGEDGEGQFTTPSVEPGLGALVGESQAFLDSLARAVSLARNRTRVLLLNGESGTGKSHLARTLHYQGGSPEGPFFTTYCTDQTPDLLAAEIFGADAGTLPGLSHRKPGLLELAGRGTVFLEEIDRLPPGLQERLAHWLDRAESTGNGRSPRIIGTVRDGLHTPGASHNRLAEELRERTGGGWVDLPPLRRRERDLELLTRFFLRRWGSVRNEPAPSMEPGAIEALYAHPWPGNVRELLEVVHSAAAFSPSRRIGEEHLRVRSRGYRPLTPGEEVAADMIVIPSGGKPWERIEEEVVQATLHLTRGNRSAAARILGISRPTLSRKIRKYDLAAVGS